LADDEESPTFMKMRGARFFSGLGRRDQNDSSEAFFRSLLGGGLEKMKQGRYQ
jgi:hypothetical protein